MLGPLEALPDQFGEGAWPGEGLNRLKAKEQEMSEIQRTYKKRRLGDPEPKCQWPTHAAGLELLEELRRSLIEVTGDPDAPMVRVVTKRRLQCPA